MVDFDIVIATRNRPDALKLSIPLLLSQERKPRQLIVVDSSNDPTPVERVVTEAASPSGIPFEFIHSEPGLPKQRNIGLVKVKSEVVFYPDDDSLLLPGALEAIMRVYELDTIGAVGGVCTAESSVPPPGILKTAKSTYKMTPYERFKQKFGARRYAFEERWFPNPFITHGRSRWTVRERPEWLETENCVLVEWMTGFRMSFRTEIIRRHGFNESFLGYALFEDVDASFAVMQDHLLIGARNGRIFHYKATGGRGSGRLQGVTQILNRAFVTCRYAEKGSEAYNQIIPYSRYKMAQYYFGNRSQDGRDRLAGARAAVRVLPELMETPAELLSAKYIELRNRCLEAKS